MKYLIASLALMSLFISTPTRAVEIQVVESFGDLDGPYIREAGFIAGAWHVIKTVDDFDDKVLHRLVWINASLDAVTVHPCLTATPSIAIVISGSIFHLEDYIDLKYRVDSNKTVEKQAIYLSRNALIRDASQMVTEMLDGESWIYKIGNRTTVKVSLNGFKEAWTNADMFCVK